LWVLWGDNIFGTDARTEHGAQVQVLRGHRGSITSLATLGDVDAVGVRLFSGAIDGTIIEWQRSKNAVSLRFPSFHAFRIFRFFEPSTSWPCSLAALNDTEILVGDSEGQLHVLEAVTMGQDIPQSPASNASAISVSGAGRLRRVAKDHELGIENLSIIESHNGGDDILVTCCNEGIVNFYALRSESDISAVKLSFKSTGHERHAGSLVPLLVPDAMTSSRRLVMLADKFDGKVTAAVELSAPEKDDGDVCMRILQQKVGEAASGSDGSTWNFCAAPGGLLSGVTNTDEDLVLVISASGSSASVQFAYVRSEVALPSLIDTSETSPVVWLGVVESAASGCLSSCVVAAHESGSLVFWDLEGGMRKPVAVMSAPARASALTSAFVCPEMSFALTGHDDGSIYQWPLTRSFKAKRTLLQPASHTNAVVGFAQIGEIILSVCIGGRANFWRTLVAEDGVSLTRLVRENMQPVVVDSSGLLCAVVFRGVCLVGANSGEIYELHGAGGNFEQVKVAKCRWWTRPSEISAVTVMRTLGGKEADEDELVVMTSANEGFIMNREGGILSGFGKLNIKVNFSFSPIAVTRRRMFVACADGSAKKVELMSEENAVVIAQVGFALSAVVVRGGRVFFGSENGRVVMVEIEDN
jgi:WD40 repeat protein